MITIKARADREASFKKAVPKNAAAARAFASSGNGHLLPPGATSTTSTLVGITDTPAGTGTPVGLTAGPGNIVVVGLEQVQVPAGANPRKRFEEASLAELAASIRQHGVLEPPLVRRLAGSGSGPRFELIAGERRLRAAKLAGCQEIQIKVLDCSQQQAAEIRLVENLQREDLDPIEEAEALRVFVESYGYSQGQLAERLSRSQASISQTLGLLKLSKPWREKLFTRVISPTHARHLLPFADVPGLLDALHKELFKQGKYVGDSAPRDGGGVPSQEVFGQDVRFELAAYGSKLARAIEGTDWCDRLCRTVKTFKPTAEQRAELAIVTIDKEEFATNTKRWDQLQAEHTARLVAKEGEKAKGKAGQKDVAEKLTPAQVKRKAQEAKQKFERRVGAWRSNWLRFLLAERCLENARFGLAVLVQALAWRGGHGGASWKWDVLCRDRLAELLEGAGDVQDDSFAAAVLGHAAPAELLVQLAADAHWDSAGDQPRETFCDALVEQMAVVAQLDLAREWKQRQAGPLTEAFFNLHGKAQLFELESELGLSCAGSHMGKAELVGCLYNARPQQLPRAIGPVVLASKATTKKVTAKSTKKKGSRS